ncbi:porin family protein [Cytophagaceae bacterium YF14B1]|uniref:Porin family protein n=1 Tax=Xanthocytophaga flava TaxID=3048013 RepID=A0AAE3QLT6_9BACT|nr:porin family protein [Xanthocytophaga flavus]MDJ1481687.1 porin family protein [Xanthocytophaga flavus]
MKNLFAIKQQAFKHLTFSLLALLSMSTYSYAQEADGVKFGIKGGLNLSNFYKTEVGDEKIKPGFNAGVFLKAPIAGEVLSIQPEVLYTLVGSETEYSNFLQGSGKYRFNLGYIQVPILLMVNLGPLNIHAGPYAAFLTNVNIKDVDDDGSIDGVTELNKDKFNSIDYGLAGGLGFDLKGATLGFRYNYGLREVGKDGGISLNGSTNASRLLRDSKNSVFQIYVGFGF